MLRNYRDDEAVIMTAVNKKLDSSHWVIVINKLALRQQFFGRPSLLNKRNGSYCT
jgi:hypothetical protein